ncbi:uncharacterized protein DSM5745_04148 [Aspergillus mulundensis]|uniref:F-box domain-containing protein n=1 Tax=Aspergillus mulundensis TaxID=1810919 RepID=A0A3D8SBT5_9EURO|nr:hypothetical protein DSM5745_04148 [Aspergillus mulundensis]RDW83822.1 hypothetical protein DSM5745_04148 [Aspergillus mulundensis]
MRSNLPISYCNICGGPFESANLRRWSTVRDGVDKERCWDDSCGGECYENGFMTESEDDGGCNPDCHGLDCSTQRGYFGWILEDKDIRWLDDVRMICHANHPAADEEIDEEGVSLSGIGVYTQLEGLHIAGAAIPNLHPNTDGFLVHGRCVETLCKVRKASKSKYPESTLSRLFITMQSSPLKRRVNVIDWNDPRTTRGEVEMFQKEERWLAFYGHEWLVMDTDTIIDYTTRIEHAASAEVVQENSPTWGPEIQRSRPEDCFSILPLEIPHMIMKHLPSSSVLNLSIASPTFHAASRHLPQSFWKSRLDHRYRWLINYDEFSETLAKVQGPINYYALLKEFEDLSADVEDEGDEDHPATNTFGLRNWRRIWNCCEAILDKIVSTTAVNRDGTISLLQPPSIPPTTIEELCFWPALSSLSVSFARPGKKGFRGFEATLKDRYLRSHDDPELETVGDNWNYDYIDGRNRKSGFRLDTEQKEIIAGMTRCFDVDGKLVGLVFHTFQKRTQRKRNFPLGTINPRNGRTVQTMRPSDRHQAKSLRVTFVGGIMEDVELNFGYIFP